jgi:hypothetical protein
MPKETAARFVYISDADRRLVHVTAFDRLTGHDLVTIIDQQREDGSWTFGLVYDIRLVEGVISQREEATVAEHVRIAVATDGPRGRVALVTKRADMLASGLEYAYRTSQNIKVKLYWDIDEAIAWVTEGQSPAS